MKKTHLLLLLVFTISLSNAQPTLDAANINPVAGESWNYLEVSISGPVNSLLSPGASQTWSVGSPGMNPYTQSFIAAAGTPYYNLFPGATHAMSDAGYYDYYKFDNTGQNYLGYSDAGNTTVYTDPQLILSLPLTYLNVFNDLFDDGNGSSGSITGIADGYGSIVLPYGTINNVLRVRITTQVIDSSSGDTIFTDSYLWYKEGVHTPVCIYGKLDYNGFTDYTLEYIDQASLSFKDDVNGAATFSVWPNPAKEKVNIYVGKNLSLNSKIDITTAEGKLVLKKDLNRNEIFSNNLLLDVGLFEKGIYFISLWEDGKKGFTKKIVID